VGDFVRDRTFKLVWKVVDRDDDGTTYIQREGVRSFTAPWNLDPVDVLTAEEWPDA
jgi:hypothetical protein